MSSKKSIIVNKKNVIIKWFIIFIIVVVACIFLIPLLVKNSKYVDAVKLKEKNKYDEAIIIFNEIKDYKDSNQQLMEIYYEYANNKIEEKDYKGAIELLEKCKNYNNSNELIIETKYIYAKKLIKSNLGNIAINILNEIVDYKDVKEIISIYYKQHQYDGIYSSINPNTKSTSRIDVRYVIDGLSNVNVYYYYFSEHIKNEDRYSSGYEHINYWPLECNKEYTSCTLETTIDDRVYTFENDKMIIKRTSKKDEDKGKTYTDTYYKITDSTELSEQSVKIGTTKPQIGMTPNEVRYSSWGEPIKINKDTYSWGTTEQWVYSNNRYVYFRNGVVSSISE